MKLKAKILSGRQGLLKIRTLRIDNRKNSAVSEIVGIILVLFIISGTVGTILLWGVPYMQDQKAAVALENALLQFDAMGDLLDDAFGEGVFDVVDQGEVASIKTMTFQLSGGNVNIDKQGERFLFWYSLVDKFNFNVTNLGPNEDEKSFYINFNEGVGKFLDFYFLYDDILLENYSIPIDGNIETSYPLHDAVQIDVKDISYNICGRIWLFDVGSLNYKSFGPSGIYKAVVENGGVLSTGVRTSGNFFNEPKYWPQTLLDNSTLLTMRIIQIKRDPTGEIDSIGGTSSSMVKFFIRPYSSITREYKKPIFSNFKMYIYGEKDVVSAWRYFYKYRLGFQGDDIDEPLIWVPPIGAINVRFTLNHAICYVGMEV